MDSNDDPSDLSNQPGDQEAAAEQQPVVDDVRPRGHPDVPVSYTHLDVYKRQLQTGERLWQWTTEAALANIGWALTADGRINGAMLYAEGWHDSMAQGAGRQFAVGAIFATPLVVDRVTYVGSTDGRMVALE